MLRGDSGFASPDIYDLCEEYDINYVIRLKENSVLKQLAEDTLNRLKTAVNLNSLDRAVAYGEFYYQANSWSHPRRVVFKIAAKIVNKSRYKYFKLCSNCLHKHEIIETLYNLQQISEQLKE